MTAPLRDTRDHSADPDDPSTGTAPCRRRSTPAPRPSGLPGELVRRLAVRVHLASCSQRGQGTVEYALVLLGAAAVALALVAWVARSGAIGRLFDAVVGRVLRSAG